MKNKFLLLIVVCALVAFAFTACQRARTDAQVAGDVQGKINADAAVQSRCLVQGQCTAQVSNGVVTLNGTVPTDAERSAVANDAAQVNGVKTVVNNLQVAPSAMANVAPAPAEQAPAQAEPQPSRTERGEAKSRNKPSGFKPPAQHDYTAESPVDYSSPATPRATNMSASNAPMGDVTPPPPPKPVDVTVPEGTTVSVRLIDPIDSEKNQPGDHFRATLDSPIVVGNAVAIPSGADVYGRVTNAKSAAHFSGRSELALELTRISVNGKSYDLHTDQFSRQGTARGKNTAEKVGGGAVLGAIIGGIAGGGKGAAIGGAVGAGAGTGVQASTHGQQIKLTSEEALSFHLEAPLTVTPSSRLNRNEGRQRLDE
jgi:hypothetical protein